MAAALKRLGSQAVLSAFWFAWEVHWAALLGAAMQAQTARFVAPGAIGTATAILSGAGAACSIVSQYLAGRASDRAGRRIPFIVAGTLLDVVALFGFALAPSFVSVVFAVFAVQISLNIAGGPYQALIPDKVPRSRQGGASAVMAFYRLAGNAVGLLAAKRLVVQPDPDVPAATVTHGLIMLAIVLSVVLLAALAVTLVGVRDEPAPKADDAASKPAVAWPERVSFVWLVVSRSLVSMGLYLILPFFAFFLRFALHVQSYLQMSLGVLLAMVGFSIIGTVPAYLLADRVSKKAVMFGALFVLAAGAAVLSQLQSTQYVIAVAIALGIGWGAYYAVDWALACNLLPAGRAGALMAIWNIGASGPQVLSPAVGGVLVDRIGAAANDPGAGYRLVFELLAVYVILGAVALGFVREPSGEGKI
ncbi:MAG TPA: MFS transporter [Candidatus Eremiobacteraceae bacterium]|nr:MFS transporter [Candidatus Eremiobacteraceae bacterium]